MLGLMKGRGSYLAHSIDGKTKIEISGISYASKDEFDSENPDCCNVVSFNTARDNGPQFTLLDHIWGNAAKLVKVKYKDRWTEDGEPKMRDHRRISRVDKLR